MSLQHPNIVRLKEIVVGSNLDKVQFIWFKYLDICCYGIYGT
jgi:hypothetical protein